MWMRRRAEQVTAGWPGTLRSPWERLRVELETPASWSHSKAWRREHEARGGGARGARGSKTLPRPVRPRVLAAGQALWAAGLPEEGDTGSPGGRGATDHCTQGDSMDVDVGGQRWPCSDGRAPRRGVWVHTHLSSTFSRTLGPRESPRRPCVGGLRVRGGPPATQSPSTASWDSGEPGTVGEGLGVTGGRLGAGGKHYTQNLMWCLWRDEAASPGAERSHTQKAETRSRPQNARREAKGGETLRSEQKTNQRAMGRWTGGREQEAREGPLPTHDTGPWGHRTPGLKLSMWTWSPRRMDGKDGLQKHVPVRSQSRG